MEVDELVAFLTARLDEDEADARDAAGGDGHWMPRRREPYLDGGSYATGHLFDSSGEVVVYDEGRPSEAEFEHIARHDPARVLREVEAKRRVLARYQYYLARMEDLGYPQTVARVQVSEYENFVLPNLTSAWSDHPDYRQEWARGQTVTRRSVQGSCR